MEVKISDGILGKDIVFASHLCLMDDKYYVKITDSSNKLIFQETLFYINNCEKIMHDRDTFSERSSGKYNILLYTEHNTLLFKIFVDDENKKYKVKYKRKNFDHYAKMSKAIEKYGYTS